MHPLFQCARDFSSTVIGGAMEVHRLKGPAHKLSLPGVPPTAQMRVIVEDKGLVFEGPLRVVSVCRAVPRNREQGRRAHPPRPKTQRLSDMKLLNAPIGLLINWHEPLLKNGNGQLILSGADQP
jgi:hypothetical protein